MYLKLIVTMTLVYIQLSQSTKDENKNFEVLPSVDKVKEMLYSVSNIGNSKPEQPNINLPETPTTSGPTISNPDTTNNFNTGIVDPEPIQVVEETELLPELNSCFCELDDFCHG